MRLFENVEFMTTREPPFWLCNAPPPSELELFENVHPSTVGSPPALIIAPPMKFGDVLFMNVQLVMVEELPMLNIPPPELSLNVHPVNVGSAYRISTAAEYAPVCSVKMQLMKVQLKLCF